MTMTKGSRESPQRSQRSNQKKNLVSPTSPTMTLKRRTNICHLPSYKTLPKFSPWSESSLNSVPTTSEAELRMALPPRFFRFSTSQMQGWQSNKIRKTSSINLIRWFRGYRVDWLARFQISDRARNLPSSMSFDKRADRTKAGLFLTYRVNRHRRMGQHKCIISVGRRK